MYTPQNQPIFTLISMKYFRENSKRSGKYVAPRRRKRHEPEEWVRKESKPETFKKIDNSVESFPTLTNNTQKAKKQEMKYDIKKLFENRRYRKKKQNKIPEGYVRIYFKNSKPCKEYGQQGTPPINNDEYNYYKKMQELDARELQAEELSELDGYKKEYIPYWIEEVTEIDDYQEECLEHDYSTESDYDDDLTDEDLDFYDMK